MRIVIASLPALIDDVARTGFAPLGKKMAAVEGHPFGIAFLRSL